MRWERCVGGAAGGLDERGVPLVGILSSNTKKTRRARAEGGTTVLVADESGSWKHSNLLSNSDESVSKG